MLPSSRRFFASYVNKHHFHLPQPDKKRCPTSRQPSGIGSSARPSPCKEQPGQSCPDEPCIHPTPGEMPQAPLSSIGSSRQKNDYFSPTNKSRTFLETSVNHQPGIFHQRVYLLPSRKYLNRLDTISQAGRHLRLAHDRIG